MLQQLESQALMSAAASGNSKAFNKALCNAVASYLTVLGPPSLLEAER